MKNILSITAISAIMILTGCSEDGTDNNATNGVLSDYNLSGDYVDYNNSNDVYTNTPADNGYNPDLGTLVSDGTDNYIASYDIDSFKSWYSSTCRETFNENLYHPETGVYEGTINCGNKDLYSIDLNYMSVFTSIHDINLSHNHLGTIDFTPLSNTEVIEILDISYNELDNEIDFSPLFNLHNINELWIQGNHIHYTREEREALYRGFNNRSLYIGF